MKTHGLAYTPFQGLKSIIERSKFTLKKNETIEVRTEEEIFREAMADVREIQEFRKIPLRKPLGKKLNSQRKDDSLEILRQIINRQKKIRLSDTGEYVEWVRPNIRKDIVQKLHSGHFSVQESIDLHGMTLEEAEEALSAFFQQSLKKTLFCVKVIHGRGLRSPKGPVLKEALMRWLQGSFRKWVLAYSTAKDCDGGLGATYIILRRGK